MSSSAKSGGLTRYTLMSDLAFTVRRTLRSALIPLAVAVAGGSIFILFTGRTGGSAFAMIGAGTLVALTVWNGRAIGLPLVPLFALQNLVIYGLPIILGHEIIAKYPASYVDKAGLEVLVFDAAMTLGWSMAMQIFAPSSRYSYVLVDVQRQGLKGLGRLGFSMIFVSTGYQVLKAMGLEDSLMNILPSGSSSIMTALVGAASACGFFVVALSVGAGGTTGSQKTAFWTTLFLNCAITGSSFLLSAVALNLCAATIGLYWGSGRLPWRFLLIVVAAMSFLNIGKFAMRDRYWSPDPDDPPPQTGLLEMPAQYLEWSMTSADLITGAKNLNVSRLSAKTSGRDEKSQTLADRIDNLQNLLFVIDAMDVGGIEPLYGKTYTLIPPLLIPRILWPDKPRTHEGQVLLNVHFGRQDLFSTYTTYVAWGLLPEAYGNFGPIAGCGLLGFFLGGFFAWIENYTSKKPVISLEGFVAFDIILNLLNSFEMVASVLVTATFQSVVPIVAACWPFVVRKKIEPPEPEAQ